MTDSKSFPIPIATLTRVHSLDISDQPVEDLSIFINQYVSLIILSDFPADPSPPLLLENANSLCTQEGALPQQRVLWVPGTAQQEALKADLAAAIEAGFPGKEFNFDNIVALSLAQGSKQAAYLIFKDPALSPDPSDARKKLSTFQMQRAFNAAILQMPNDTDQ